VVSERAPGEGPARVLVVEDDVTVSEVVKRYLEREGFEVECMGDGAVALERAVATLPDLVILDIMLPSMDGLEVCRKLRAKAPIPIIMLTALGEESDRVMGLELGADDYMAKPFSPRELTARVKSVLRRAHGPLSPSAPELRAPLTAGDLEVDVGAHEVKVGGQPVALTTREFELLVWFVLHPRQVFTRADLLEKVWGYKYGDDSTVTVHVRRLREKVESNPTDPDLIKTVWGVGYRFDP
jgi:DNA-binding response OmpR family regulator